MNKDRVKEWIEKSCDKDKVSAWCNGFWTITQEELERFAKFAYDAGELVTNAKLHKLQSVNNELLKALEGVMYWRTDWPEWEDARNAIAKAKSEN